MRKYFFQAIFGFNISQPWQQKSPLSQIKSTVFCQTGVFPPKTNLTTFKIQHPSRHEIVRGIGLWHKNLVFMATKNLNKNLPRHLRQIIGFGVQLDVALAWAVRYQLQLMRLHVECVGNTVTDPSLQMGWVPFVMYISIFRVLVVFQIVFVYTIVFVSHDYMALMIVGRCFASFKTFVQLKRRLMRRDARLKKQKLFSTPANLLCCMCTFLLFPVQFFLKIKAYFSIIVFSFTHRCRWKIELLVTVTRFRITGLASRQSLELKTPGRKRYVL